MNNLGTNSIEAVDYPDFSKKLVQELKKNKDAFGVLICGTGIGMSISANRYNIYGCLMYRYKHGCYE